MKLAEGRMGRMIAVRLAPGEDVLLGLEQACRDANIQHGAIVSCIGSLNGASFLNPVPLPHKKAGYGYSNPIQLHGPIELLQASGMICLGEQGETLLHVHCSFSDQEGKGYGGHLIEGNKVLLTVDAVIGELDGIHMGRRYDPELEVLIFNPETKQKGME